MNPYKKNFRPTKILGKTVKYYRSTIAINYITSGHSRFKCSAYYSPQETFQMMGHLISSNNVKLIKI